VGLIQKVIEAAGIPTVSISIVKEITERVRPPRAVFLPWPLGHPMGEPGHAAQQRRVLLDALGLLESAWPPSELLEPGYEWGRHSFDE
jgi:D-proline reductase (dithiol) PrdB